MGRKTDDERTERQEEMLRFRWEFTRDNPEYRAAYQEALKLRRDSLMETMDNYFMTSQGKKEQALARKFGLLGDYMFDPAMSYEDLTTHEGAADIFEKQNFRPVTFYSHFTNVNLDLRTKKMHIEIDLTRVNSFEALGLEVKRLVDFELNQKGKPLKDRKHFKPGGIHSKGKDLYDILLTGRLYNEIQAQQDKRVTFKQLAQAMKPGQFKTDPEGQRRKAEATFHEYERLVNGGYREITYP